ncbi:MAG TPA: CaiB/BaiF CoA-transferase family protein [Acidimicrobiia bacterium]|nr:CaiB/BaiF CoA-transferase family protein [Acidimicrobiia bacterium]
MTDGPLSHLRVLDLSRAQPGAYCTGVLADLGADVLRVEPRGTGDTTRIIPGAMEAYHRGKRAMTLDLKHDDAPGILRRLIADVDVVVESGLPASLRAAGIDHATLSAERPELVWCAISGFGEGSPYARRPAHDVTFLGYSGLMALMAGDTVPPTPDFVLAVPFGSLVAVVGILAALTERDRTGQGAFVDTAIVDSATWVLGEAVARVASGQPAGWGEAASRRAYRAADGKLVTLAAAEPRTWAAFCAAVDRPDLADALANPPGGQAGLADELARLFATKSAAEWEAQLADAGAAVGPVRTVEELLADPHLEARGSLVALDDDAGTRVLRTPVRLRDATGAERPVQLGAPPALGEHTDTALADAGFDPKEIADFHDRGAV